MTRRPLVCATFAAVLLAASAGRAAAQDTVSLNPLTTLDKAALTGFVERPLFDPERRLPPPAPVLAEAPPPPAPVEPAPSLQLLGIVHGLHDMAIVHRDGGQQTIVLHTGDKLGSWTVTVRPPVGVSLSSGDRTVDFAIFAKMAQPAPRDRPMAVGTMIRRQNLDN